MASNPNLSMPPREEGGATFINITHPAQRKDIATRRKVAQYIGLHFRNRSKPVARREANATRSKPPGKARASQRPIRARGVAAPSRIYRDLHGFRSDPFRSYPIPDQAGVSEAVDFCKKLALPSPCLPFPGLD
jgi:hypothetical protein